MSKSVKESLELISNAFDKVYESATLADKSFNDEGEQYIYAANAMKDRALSDTANHVCSYFSDVAKLHSNKSILVGLDSEVVTEQDKALLDHRLFGLRKQIEEVSLLNIKYLNVIRNNDYYASNDIDKKTFAHFNDEVRLINSLEYQRYKASEMTPVPRKVLPTVSREEKEKHVLDDLLKAKEPKMLEEAAKSVPDFRKPKEPRKRKPADYKVAQTIGWISGIILGAVIGFFIDTPDLLITIGICLFAAAAVGFVGSKIGSGVCGKINSNREKAYNRELENNSKYHVMKKAAKEKAINNARLYVKEKYRQEFDLRIAILEDKERKSQALEDARVDKANEWYNKYAYDQQGRKISVNDARNGYYKAIARIATTSAPVLSGLMENANVVGRYTEIIKNEYQNLLELTGAKNVSEDALICLSYLNSGDVATYEQAIQMKKNLDDATRARANYQQEQEKKRLEEEAKHQAWLAKYRKEEAEREEKERIEYQRKMDELDRRAAERNRTIAIAAGALAISQSINEHNEALEKIAKQLEQ